MSPISHSSTGRIDLHDPSITFLKDSIVTRNSTTHLDPEPPATVFFVAQELKSQPVLASLQAARFHIQMYRSGNELLEQLTEAMIGCIVVDCPLPDMTGRQVQARLNAREIRMPLVFLAAGNHVRSAVEAIQQGAFDYLVKPVDTNLMHERVAKAIVQNRRSEKGRRTLQRRARLLTSRETEVMALLAAGQSMKRIAAHLRITVQTVTKHRSRVLSKMRVENNVQLVNMLYAK